MITPTFAACETLDISGVDDSTAGFWSSVYPISGAVATLLCGFLSDKLPGRRRYAKSHFVFSSCEDIVLVFSVFQLKVSGDEHSASAEDLSP